MNHLKTGYDLFWHTLPAVAERLQLIDNLLAFGIGLKVTGGIVQQNLAYRIYVKQKRDQAAFQASQLIPSSIFNLQTDVLEPHILDNHTESTVTRRDIEGSVVAIPISSSIRSNTFGTLGSIGQLLNGSQVFLTNKHVVYNSLPGIDTRHFPVYIKSENNFEERAVATTLMGIKNEWVDCALLRSHNLNHPDTEHVENNLPLPEVFPGDTVTKVGVGSGVTKGYILHKGDMATIDPSGTIAVHRSKLIIHPGLETGHSSIGVKKIFSCAGDSGSAVLNDDNRTAGLIHAGLKDVHVNLSLASEISQVTKACIDNGYPVIPGSWNSDFSAMTGNVSSFKNKSVDDDLKNITWLVLLHKREVTSLIKSSRLVRAIWVSHQGPAFTAGFSKYLDGSTTLVSKEHNGVSFSEMFQKMIEVLAAKGSDQLREDIRLYKDLFARELEKLLI